MMSLDQLREVVANGQIDWVWIDHQIRHYAKKKEEIQNRTGVLQRIYDEAILLRAIYQCQI